MVMLCPPSGHGFTWVIHDFAPTLPVRKQRKRYKGQAQIGTWGLFLGHSNISVTMRDVYPPPEHKRAAIKSWSGSMSSQCSRRLKGRRGPHQIPHSNPLCTWGETVNVLKRKHAVRCVSG